VAIALFSNFLQSLLPTTSVTEAASFFEGEPIMQPTTGFVVNLCRVSLVLGLFRDFSQTRPAGEPPVDWVKGVAIFVAILIVVGVGSINDGHFCWYEKFQWSYYDGFVLCCSFIWG
jgi:hypothetical protein